MGDFAKVAEYNSDCSVATGRVMYLRADATCYAVPERNGGSARYRYGWCNADGFVLQMRCWADTCAPRDCEGYPLHFNSTRFLCFC